MKLDDGLLTVYRLKNTAEEGMMPKLSECEILRACYAERTVGSTRYYNALQADQQIDLLLRIPRSYDLVTGDRVRIHPYAFLEPSLPYLIIQIQQVQDDETRLPATDLSLRVMRESEVEQ